VTDEAITIPTESELTAWIDGAWARHGRRIGGGAFDEPASVLWLTVSPYFCDLRFFNRQEPKPNPLDRSQAFSGTVSVTENIVTWSHDLDTTERARDHADSAPMIGHPGELLEIGDEYEERWLRTEIGGEAAGAAEIVGADDSPLARIVLVGMTAIAVWAEPTPGGALLERSEGWSTSRLLGEEPCELALAEVCAALTGGGALPGWWKRIA
jgi:hypothetical protein